MRWWAKLWRPYGPLLALSTALGLAISVAIVSVSFAMGLIDTEPALAELDTFLTNVGYSIFAGGVILAMVEFSRALFRFFRSNEE